jgi:hypothetical protein
VRSTSIFTGEREKKAVTVSTSSVRAIAMHIGPGSGSGGSEIKERRKALKISPRESSPISRLVTPHQEFPRFPSPVPVSPRPVKRFSRLQPYFCDRGFAYDPFVLLILRLASEVHEAGPLVDIGVNCFAVVDVTFERVRSCSKIPHLPLGVWRRENLKTGCRQQRLNPRLRQGCRPSETIQRDTD